MTTVIPPQLSDPGPLAQYPISSEGVPEAPSPPGLLDALPGGPLIWIVFLLEMGTFALFFLGFAWQSRSEPAIFAKAQALLHPNLGTLNTLILLCGSWMAARAVHAGRRQGSVSPWLIGAGLSGLAFLAVKGVEYTAVFSQGIRLSTNAFWFNYLFLTLLHNLHVAVGIGFLFYLAWTCRSAPLSPQNSDHLEAAALYWHLVDVIWVLLFPLLYFSRSG